MCLHNDWLDSATCSICVNGVAHDQAKPGTNKTILGQVDLPETKPAKPKPAYDPFMVEVERYASGAWCVECGTPVHRGLCACDREARFELHKDVLHEWASQQPDSKAAMFLAHGALGREITRAGIGDQEQDGLPVGVSRRQAEMALDRAGGLDGRKRVIEPKWRKAQASVAEPLPIPA